MRNILNKLPGQFSNMAKRLKLRQSAALFFIIIATLWVLVQVWLVWANKGTTTLAPRWISIELTYIALFSIVASVIWYRVLRHKDTVLMSRKVDSHELQSMLTEADTVEPTVMSEDLEIKRPENYLKKLDDLQKEATRLRSLIENENEYILTEYDVLALDQMLVDFLQAEDLVASARSRLESLKDFAEDTARDYYWATYYARENLIAKSIQRIEDAKKEEKSNKDFKSREKLIDDNCAELRSNLVDLLEHIASYDMAWAEGSAIVRGIILTGVISILPLIAMGLLPILYAYGDAKLSPCITCIPTSCLYIYNWGFLGIAGAITAVLRTLRKTDLVEVGDTKGRAELWRAVLSAGLGLVAGIISYSLFAAELVHGVIIPVVNSQTAQNIGLSIAWAFAAGLFFESIFDRLKSSTVGNG